MGPEIRQQGVVDLGTTVRGDSVTRFSKRNYLGCILGVEVVSNDLEARDSFVLVGQLSAEASQRVVDTLREYDSDHHLAKVKRKKNLKGINLDSCCSEFTP